ncbi:MAG: histidine kinase [Bacteroidota bacterium]
MENKHKSAPAYWKALGLLALLYVFFATFYMVFQELSFDPDFRTGLNWRTLYLDYPIKAVFSLVVWFLIFRLFRSWKRIYRIGLAILIGPLWVKGWQQIYYWLIDEYWNGNRFVGYAEWSDIYVPSLFYCIQFGIFFAYEYHWDLRASEQAEAESAQLALTSELTALKTQLNPHFLYNAFNAISASVPPGQETTREMIAQLSNMFRYQLRAARTDLVTLREELSFVEDYLDLEKARFGDRLQSSINVADELLNAGVPPMILQPLVENAVRHGIYPLVNGGLVTIFATTNQQELQLHVQDTGVGLTTEALNRSNGFGIPNTRRRLQLLYNSDLVLEELPGGGTSIKIVIPLVYVAENSPDRRRSPRPETAPRVPD